VKIKITSNEELMRIGGTKINKSIKLAKKKRERPRLTCLSNGRRRTVDTENGEFRMEKFEGDSREFKSLEGRTGR